MFGYIVSMHAYWEFFLYNLNVNIIIYDVNTRNVKLFQESFVNAESREIRFEVEYAVKLCARRYMNGQLSA